MRKTDDDPSGSPTYTAWQPLANGVLKARAFQFKAVLTSSDQAQNILVDELGYKAQFQQRTEQSTATIASGTSAKAVTFTNAFFTGTTALGGANSALPTIGITPLNMATGDFFELSVFQGLASPLRSRTVAEQSLTGTSTTWQQALASRKLSAIVR